MAIKTAAGMAVRIGAKRTEVVTANGLSDASTVRGNAAAIRAARTLGTTANTAAKPNRTIDGVMAALAVT